MKLFKKRKFEVVWWIEFSGLSHSEYQKRVSPIFNSKYFQKFWNYFFRWLSLLLLSHWLRNYKCAHKLMISKPGCEQGYSKVVKFETLC